MTRPTMGRLNTLVALAGAVLLAACGDATTAPQASSLGVKKNTVTLSRDEAGTGAFTIEPGKRITVIMGSHRVTIPANAVCDPSTSTYGEGQWDAPCTPLTEPLTMTATWGVDDHGKATVSFSPDVRFVPAADDAKNDWVVLQLRNPTALEVGSFHQILWQNAAGQWVDEAMTDPSLRPWTNGSENKVSRRLKHFSGYVIGVGFTEGTNLEGEVGIEVIAQ